MKTKYRYTVEIDEDDFINVWPEAKYSEPYGSAMANEIAAAIESALQDDYIGGWELDDGGEWIKPLDARVA